MNGKVYSTNEVGRIQGSETKCCVRRRDSNGLVVASHEWPQH